MSPGPIPASSRARLPLIAALIGIVACDAGSKGAALGEPTTTDASTDDGGAAAGSGGGAGAQGTAGSRPPASSTAGVGGDAGGTAGLGGGTGGTAGLGGSAGSTAGAAGTAPPSCTPTPISHNDRSCPDLGVIFQTEQLAVACAAGVRCEFLIPTSFGNPCLQPPRLVPFVCCDGSQFVSSSECALDAGPDR
jgi:hypothetical protein